jgi:predicted PurR-regulated permease PerM
MQLLQRKGLLIFLAGLFCLFVIVYSMHAILTPFLVGALIAYLLDPAVQFLNRKGVNRSLAVLLIFGVFALFSIIASVLIVPILVGQLINFVFQLPEYVHWLYESISMVLTQYFGVSIDSLDIEKIKRVVQENWQSAGQLLTNFFIRISGSTLGLILAVTNYVLVPIVAFYFLRDWDRFTDSVDSLIPRKFEPTIKTILTECDEVLGSFIRGQLVVMFLLGVIYSTGLAIVGVELALFLGMLAGLASVVPYLGAFVGILSASLAAFMQFQDIMPVIYVLMVFATGQFIESFFLTPLLVGDKIGLHPVAVNFAIMAGGQLGGFTGILIALPVAAVLMVLVRFFVNHYMASSFYNDNTQAFDSIGSGSDHSENIVRQPEDEKASHVDSVGDDHG